jgi:hypothetical protein
MNLIQSFKLNRFGNTEVCESIYSYHNCTVTRIAFSHLTGNHENGSIWKLHRFGLADV